MKKPSPRKLALSRETVTALEARSMRWAGGGPLDSNYDCSSACFAVSNRDQVC